MVKPVLVTPTGAVRQTRQTRKRNENTKTSTAKIYSRVTKLQKMKNTPREKETTRLKDTPRTTFKNRVYKSPIEVKQKYPYLSPYKLEDIDTPFEKKFSLDENGFKGRIPEEYSGGHIPEEYSDSRMQGEYSEDNNYDDEDDEEEIEDEEGECMEDEEMEQEEQNKQNFSISSLLGRNEKSSLSDNLRKAIANGNALDIGQCIREGFRNKLLSELQIEEISKTVPRPSISLLQHFRSCENATQDQKDSINMGTMFLLKMALSESTGFQKLKASVNSLSTSFANQTKVGLLTKRTLEVDHVIEAVGVFPRINLTSFYNRSNLSGESAFSQMTLLLMKVFQSILTPKYSIWYYSYRPKCVRPADKHFIPFPSEIVEELEGFAYDAVGIHLPLHLLHGPVDLSDPFVTQLNVTDKVKEIARRRDERDNVSQTMQQSIGHMLNYSRDYHYNIQSDELVICKARQECKVHLTWKDVKSYRADCRKNGTDPNNFDLRNAIGFSSRS